MRCNARAKQSGKQCTKQAIGDTTKCRYHGGLSLKGPASPSWKTGRHSKYLPAKLLDRYQEAQNDPDLLALRSEIALTDTRLSELLERIDDGGGIEDWSRVNSAWRELLDAQRRMNAAATEERRESARLKISENTRLLNDLIMNGSQSASLWHEIHETMENRRRLVSTESKRLTDMQQMITAEKATGLIYALLAILRTRITDVQLLSAISADIRGLLTRNAGE